jgi:hypothetical protein
LRLGHWKRRWDPKLGNRQSGCLRRSGDFLAFVSGEATSTKAYRIGLLLASRSGTLQSQFVVIIAKSHQKLTGGPGDCGTTTGTGTAGIGSGSFRLAFTIGGFLCTHTLERAFKGLSDAMTTAEGFVSGGGKTGGGTTGAATAARCCGRAERLRYGRHTTYRKTSSTIMIEIQKRRFSRTAVHPLGGRPEWVVKHRTFKKQGQEKRSADPSARSVGRLQVPAPLR